MLKVLFIGLGAMGAPMAGCLVRVGFDVSAFDISRERVSGFTRQHGGRAIFELCDFDRETDVVVMILPNSAVVQDVLFGQIKLAQQLKPGAVVIDMTSGVPALTIEISRQLAQQDIVFFDAPVSGAVARAQAGDLTIMVGGDDTQVGGVLGVLSAMGTVTRAGPVGSGDAMKALNNLVSCGGYLIGIEALLIGSRFGLDPEKMLEVFNTSTGMNNSTQKKFSQYVLSRKFDSGFPIHMMLKDLNNATDLAHQLGVTTPFSQLCRDLWAGASNLLGPDADHTAVACMSEQMAGSRINS